MLCLVETTNDRDNYDNKELNLPVFYWSIVRQNWRKLLNEIGKIFKEEKSI